MVKAAFRKMYPVGRDQSIYEDAPEVGAPEGSLTAVRLNTLTAPFDLSTRSENVINLALYPELNSNTMTFTNAQPGVIYHLACKTNPLTQIAVTFSDKVLHPDGSNTITLTDWDYVVSLMCVDSSVMVIIGNVGGYTLSTV